jgi:purine-nucleoside phosphorylase
MSSSAFTELRDLVLDRRPPVAVILGSGLNQVVDDLPCLASARFDELPGMPATNVTGHRGRLGLFEFTGSTLFVFQGRLHRYEGHSKEIVERPVRLAFDWGARTILLTNACGGIGPRQQAGTLMAIRDHIDAMRPNWWRERSQEPTSPYSLDLMRLLRQAAAESGVELTEGVYAGVTGPNYETPAEVQALKAIGADAVGMSTILEANAAHSLGMKVAAVSCIANRAAGLSANPLSHLDVLSVVQSAAARMSRLLRAFLTEVVANQGT